MNKYLVKIARLSDKQFAEEYEKRSRPFVVADAAIAGGMLGGLAGYGAGSKVYTKYHKKVVVPKHVMKPLTLRETMQGMKYRKAPAISTGKIRNFASNVGLAGAAVGGAAAGYGAYKFLYRKDKKK